MPAKLIHKLTAGKGTLGIGQELKQDLKLPQGQRYGLPIYRGDHCVLVQHQISHRQFFLCCDVGPPE